MKRKCKSVNNNDDNIFCLGIIQPRFYHQKKKKPFKAAQTKKCAKYRTPVPSFSTVIWRARMLLSRRPALKGQIRRLWEAVCSRPAGWPAPSAPLDPGSKTRCWTRPLRTTRDQSLHSAQDELSMWTPVDGREFFLSLPWQQHSLQTLPPHPTHVKAVCDSAAVESVLES